MIGATRLRLVPPIPRQRRWCACCEVALPPLSPAYRRYCLQCYRWIRLGAALRDARRWFGAEGAI